VTQLPARIDTDPENIAHDLGRLVLTLVELIRQLMERQAIRRVEAGDLSEETIERLGLGLMRLEEAMADLREQFGLDPADLNIDLGPLGKLLPPLADTP
jgi:gas vesicle protein GvpK